MAMDIPARGLALQALRKISRPPQNIGTRIFGGRWANTRDLVASPQTYESLMTVAAPFDAFRLIFGQANNAGLTASNVTVKSGVALVPDVSDAAVGALISTDYQAVTFAGGSVTGTLAPAASERGRSYLISDWIPLPSVPRTDGGSLPAIVVRAYASGGLGVLQGIASTNFAPWYTHPSGRIWKTYRRAGDYVTSSQNLYRSGATATTTGETVIVGIQYLARGKVQNIIPFGDSITEGPGNGTSPSSGTYAGEGFMLPAAISLDRPALAVEYSDLGWSSATASDFLSNIQSAIAAGIVARGDVCPLPTGSNNDTAAPITDLAIKVMRGKLGICSALLQQAGAIPLRWTYPSFNTSVKAYGTSDAKRRALNDEWRALATTNGMVVADIDATLAGVDDGTGQVQLKAGYTADGAHPNDAGNALAAPVMSRALAQMIALSAGILIA